MDWQLIESDEEMAGVIARARQCAAVAVDTEFMRRNTFYPQVALLQLCFDDTAWLIDPLAIEDPTPIAELLSDTSVVKVLHSASEDLEVFQHWLGVLPVPLFDTQRAAAMLNLGFGLGYRALVQSLCDVDLPKGETRSDWLQRPLTQSQCEYAAQDVTWLLRIWQQLEAQCIARGRMDWVLADGVDATGNLATAAGQYYRRIKNAWKLNPRQLSALIAICGWREDVARTRDKPRSWIIDDKACMQLAQNDPANNAQLANETELPPPALRRYGDDLLTLLEEQRELDDSALPPRLPGPLDATERALMKSLKSSVRAIAEGLEVAPEILLSSRDYEALIREDRGELDNSPLHWRGWRLDTVLAPLRKQLAEAS